ncbi:hypothetical protein EDEG_00665 [Edhazardia aedis USNM 41457]|uniref:Suppressor of forked domain-containing protein n=1 Tax=Edhazardia aedis (strain USNM 41457) TaxID=1003232 RepID=J9DCS5_EDHAE|nr:hypothetical protein EDEG_00665 [Edhazardia aedis USNM 41457]|eukprot:EJW05269.1 hypothetical protein EDEG_00665 [Edhazardia aedis USNM 41457]
MLNYAETLMKNEDYKKLHDYLEANLKTSTDVRFLRVYIEYIKVQARHVDLPKVYDFVLKRLYHHWDVFSFFKEYIKILQEDVKLSEEERNEIIRANFHKLFLTPMNNFNTLWKEYEAFENEVNKGTAKKMLADVLPIFQKTFRLYTLYKNYLNYSQKLTQDQIVFDDFFEILDIESRNVAFFDEKHLKARMDFIFNFFSQHFDKEEIYFTWAEYLKKEGNVDEALSVVKKGIEKVDDKFFLYCYYGTLSNVHLFDKAFEHYNSEFGESKAQNDIYDILVINHLNFILKNENLSAFRTLFIEYVFKEIGPQVFIFVANAEYFTLNDKDIAFRIFTKALEKYPDNVDIQEAFVKFLIKANDLANLRALFETFEKTQSICTMVAEFEFMYGKYEKFREVIKYIKRDSLPKEQNLLSMTFKNQFEKDFNLFKRNIFSINLKDNTNPLFKQFLEKVSHISLPKINSDSVIEFLRTLKLD